MIIAIKGEHNSGKTTFIQKLIEKMKDYKIMVIKSSGQENVDVAGKDSYYFRKKGAHASIVVAKNETALFTNSMDLKEAINLAEKFFPDVIIIEGYESIENLRCTVIDMEEKPDVDAVCQKILREVKKIKIFVDGEELHLNKFVENLIYKTIKAMISSLKGGDGNEIEIMLKCL